jgi:hypothetical protein
MRQFTLKAESLLISVLTASLDGKMNRQSNTPMGGGGGTAASPRHESMLRVANIDAPNFNVSCTFPISLIRNDCFQFAQHPKG